MTLRLSAMFESRMKEVMTTWRKAVRRQGKQIPNQLVDLLVLKCKPITVTCEFLKEKFLVRCLMNSECCIIGAG